jgi:hypothetical protein
MKWLLGVSETCFRRHILAQFADSHRPEHEFQRLYDRLYGICSEHLGWQILLPLAQQDSHCLQAIRVPSSEEQKDFDDLVLALTKILVDSLNERELSKLIPASETGNLKNSISRFQRVLQISGFSGHEDHIKFLRNLQSLRSSGAAHRKGSNYQKIAKELNVDSKSLIDVFKGILVRSIDFLNFLESVVLSKRLLIFKN